MNSQTKCRGGCGRDVYVSQTSSPDGPTCRACRRDERLLPDRVCVVCSVPFRVRSKTQFTCSPTCAHAWLRDTWMLGNAAREAAVDAVGGVTS